jgi:hypothetical protein
MTNDYVIGETFISAIRQGRLDRHLSAIVLAVEKREQAQNEDLLKQVQARYGEKAKIVIETPCGWEPV